LQELRDRKIVGTVAKGNAGGSPPLKLTIARSRDTEIFKIIPGTVNTLTPTLDGDPITDDPPPEFLVTSDAKAYVKVEGTFGTPDSYVVTIYIQEPAGSNPAEVISGTGFTSYYLIGQASPDFGPQNVHSGGNLGVESFGAVNFWWKV
jgi:hypothetical protein